MRRTFLYSVSFSLVCFAACGGGAFTDTAPNSGTTSTGAGGAGTTASSGTGSMTTATSSTSASASVGSGGAGGSDVGVATSSVSTGPLGPENCTNGKDDNGDGLIDCADPQCGTYSCVAAAPADWTPVEFSTNAFDAKLPACDPDFGGVNVVGDSGTLTANPATCTQCACNVTNLECGVPSVALGENGCASAVKGGKYVALPPLVGNFCATIPAEPFVASGFSVGEVPWTGTCTASGGIATVPPVSWSAANEFCQVPAVGAGCSDAKVCAPKPSANFSASVCIEHDGDVPCPAGPYQMQTVIYQKTTDTRGCPCSCSGTPTGVTCTGEVDVYNVGDPCPGEFPLPIPTGSCAQTPVGQTLGSYGYTPNGNDPMGGTCAQPPVPTIATGAAAGALPVTVCCQQ